ncbi:MAG TPA: prolyl oligopeptidase family serine peptidase [Terriglobales bacterium]|nr:prolyl oligopeptidase family serine peptidase [Terriglobales bacterium]
MKLAKLLGLGLFVTMAALALGAQQRPIGLDDIMAWKGTAGTAVSNNGAWFGYRLTSLEGDGQVVFRESHGDKQYTFNIGEAPVPPYGGGGGGRGGGAAANLAFSSDGHYAAFLAYPTHAAQAALRRQRKPIETHAGLVDLATGKEVNFARVRRFAFSGDNPAWVAMQKLPPAPANAGAGGGAAGRGGRGGAANTESDPEGTDLILRELASGQEANLGSVGEFSFNRAGRYLAWTIAATDKAGNGVQYRDLTTGSTRSLDSDDQAIYRHLTWNETGTALAALKGTQDRAWQEKVYSVIGFTHFDGEAAPREVVFDPAKATGFPEGMSVSPNRAPAWSDDLQSFSFGIRALKPREPGANAADDAAAPAPADDPADKVNLVIWNYQDPRLQSEQIVEASQDENFSYLAEYRLDSGKFIRLADDTVREVTIAPHQRFAVGRSVAPYELMSHLDGQRFTDLYTIDLASGERKLAIQKCRYPDGVSPDGTRFAYYQDGNYWDYDMASGTSRNLTAGVATSFINHEDDHNVVNPPEPMLGWTSDSRNLLLSDGWDIWRVPVAAGAAANLTGDGKQQQIRYRQPMILDEDQHGYNLSKPLYLEAYGEWTKKNGLALITPGQPGAHRIMFDEAAYGGLVKAKKADDYFFTRQTYQDAPDYYVADATLTNPRRLTQLGDQQKPFLWSSGTILVNYTSAKGDKLQGALHLPADYQKGKQYPTIVYYYEKMSQNAFEYARPTGNGFSISAYNSNGYAVFDPDITYKVNDPGMSAVWCLVPAVKAAIATGVVDAKHVGIHGHSWGGYQTAFTVTQTDMFAAAIAGAPLTDMISMYDLVYKNSGVTNGEIFEASQGRFSSGPWDNWEAYTRNSPVAQVKNVHTPLLILSDDTDGAVDFTQGMEYFNALRRLGKPVVLLEYPGENHSLARRANQKDYTVRMKEFFDHYLKDAPMPVWYGKGIPHIAMADYLNSLQEKPKAAATVAAPAGVKNH